MVTETVYTHRERCRLCNSAAVEKAVVLEPIPIKSPNLGAQQGIEEMVVPVDLYRCPDCGLIQLLDLIDPQVQYADFRYRTSISLGLPSHFEQLAQAVLQRYGRGETHFVLEIGSNDGTLLRAFQQHEGCTVLGVDPSQPVSEIARTREVPTITGFFTAALAEELVATHGQAQIILCNNTFANIDDLNGFVEGVRTMLAQQGVFVIETAHGLSVIENFQIDTVYHEHLSYFLVSSLDRWFTTQEMELIEAEPIETKGGSIRLVVQHQGGPFERKVTVDQLVAQERAAKLFSDLPFQHFSTTVSAARDAVSALAQQVVERGGTVAGYGASVGSLTLLYQLGLATQIRYFVDENPLAEALSLPDRQLPIVGQEILRSDPPDLVVIFAFRYAEPIIEKNRDYLAQGGRFAIPIPVLKVVEEVERG